MYVEIIKVWAESHKRWMYIKLDKIYKIPITEKTYLHLRENGVPTAQSLRNGK